MHSAWLVVLPENSLATNYPDCEVQDSSKIGDGICDNGDGYNMAACGYDDGDCDVFNEKYHGCKAPDLSMMLGDGICLNSSGLYNTEACKYDGGDCDEFNANYPGCKALNPSLLGNGHCDSGPYNTAGCGYDGGDCN